MGLVCVSQDENQIMNPLIQEYCIKFTQKLWKTGLMRETKLSN